MAKQNPHACATSISGIAYMDVNVVCLSLNSKFVSICNDEMIEVSSDESCKADSEEDVGLQNTVCESLHEHR